MSPPADPGAGRRLLVCLVVVGGVLGLAGAVVLHGLPATLVGDGSFFAWAAPSLFPRRAPVTVTLNWWPSLAVLPGLGAVAGLGIAAVLRTRGWGLTRTAPGDAS